MLCGLEAQDIYFLIPYSNMLFYFFCILFYGYIKYVIFQLEIIFRVVIDSLIVTDDKGKIKIS